MAVKQMKTIALLNGGGEAPGLNAVTWAVYRSGVAKGYRILGIRDGYDGLIDTDQNQYLTDAHITGILSLGGTILGTANHGERFASKVGLSEIKKIDPQVIKQASDYLKQEGVEGLICVGGDGTLTTAHQLSQAGIPIVGVPKTIDNDLMATDKTFGFDTAVEGTGKDIMSIQRSLNSLGRVGLIEVFGRDAGWIALLSSIATEVDGILIPEIPYKIESIAEQIHIRKHSGQRGVAVVVAEGAIPHDGKRTYISHSATAQNRYGGVASRLKDQLSEIYPQYDYMASALKHQERGAHPITSDISLARSYGHRAFEGVITGEFGKMVSLQNNRIVTVPLEDAIGHGIRTVPTDSEQIKMARQQGIFFGD
jgi:6-phosphofructokinase